MRGEMHTLSSLAVTMLDAFLGLPFSLLSLPVSSLPICACTDTAPFILHRQECPA